MVGRPWFCSVKLIQANLSKPKQRKGKPSQAKSSQATHGQEEPSQAKPSKPETHLRSERVERLPRGELVALPLGLREYDSVRTLAIEGDDVLQHRRAMAGVYLDSHVRHRRRQLVVLHNNDPIARDNKTMCVIMHMHK